MRTHISWLPAFDSTIITNCCAATLLLQDRRQPFEEVPSPTESESDEEPVPPLGAQRSPQSPEPSALDRLRAIVSEHGDAQDSQVSTLANADLPSRTPTMEMPLV